MNNILPSPPDEEVSALSKALWLLLTVGVGTFDNDRKESEATEPYREPVDNFFSFLPN